MTDVRPLLRLGYAVPAALLSGLVMWLAFAPVAFGPAAIGSVALLTSALWHSSIRRGLALGLVAGVAFFAPLLSWMQVVGLDAWVLLSVFCALWWALMGGGIALVTRLPGAPLWVACIWVLQEALRGSVPWGGFPWGEIAFGQPDTVFARLAAYGGSSFVSFSLAFIGAAVVTAALDARARQWALTAVWGLCVGGLVLGSVLLPVGADGDDVGGPPSAVAAIVQGGTPQFGLGALDVRRAVLDNHVAQTKALAAAIAGGDAPQPEFVVWPENSSDLDPFTDPSVAADITAAARAVQAPILVGAVIDAATDPRGIWNVGIVWDPIAGPTQMYIKTHPVPFGEYIPFRDFLAEHVGRFDRVPRDFLPGDRPGNLTIAGIPVGNVICFEVAYDVVVDAVVDGGARLLTVQTNNATYGGTPQPAQQLAITRMRAIEFGRTVAVAATSGISAFIDGTGAVSARLDEGTAGWMAESVALRGHLTLASRVGHVVKALLCALGLGAIVAAAALRAARRRRRSIA